MAVARLDSQGQALWLNRNNGRIKRWEDGISVRSGNLIRPRTTLRIRDVYALKNRLDPNHFKFDTKWPLLIQRNGEGPPNGIGPLGGDRAITPFWGQNYRNLVEHPDAHKTTVFALIARPEAPFKHSPNNPNDSKQSQALQKHSKGCNTLHVKVFSPVGSTKILMKPFHELPAPRPKQPRKVWSA